MGILNVFPISGLDVAAMAVTYTGTKSLDSIVTMGGAQYRLLRLTSSGTLTFPEAVKADVCAVGGGAAGMSKGNTSRRRPGSPGGAGGKLANAYNKSVASIVVTVGAAEGATSVGSLASAAAVSGKSGGTGGGAAGYGNATNDCGAGTGDSASKYPFADTAYFYPHCGGGGGGMGWRFIPGEDYDEEFYSMGGNGGTNGGAGGACGTEQISQPGLSAGGSTGGGAGGRTNGAVATAGGNATYYGAGGGGAGAWGTSSQQVPGGAGYQGAAYVRIPLEQ